MTTDMKKRCTVGLLTAGLVSSLSTGSRAAATGQDAGARANEVSLLAELDATGPHSSMADQAEVVGRLVGSLDVEYMHFAKDGKTNHRTGAFIVGWVMDGRAIQILWIVDPSGTRKDREVYTNLHWFDPKTRAWRSAFVDPEHGSVARFTGGPVEQDRFVLETEDFGGGKSRWSANDIRGDSFVWRDEASSDGGKTWRLQAEYRMKRRATDSR
jgi:hypothetical protein